MGSRRIVLHTRLRDDAAAIAAYEQYHSHPWPEILEYCHQLGIDRLSIYRAGAILVQIIESDGLDVASIGQGVEGRAHDWIELMTTFMDAPPSTSGGWTEVAEIFRWENSAGVTITPEQVGAAR